MRTQISPGISLQYFSGSVAPQVIRDLDEYIMTMNDLGAMTLELHSQFI